MFTTLKKIWVIFIPFLIFVLGTLAVVIWDSTKSSLGKPSVNYIESEVVIINLASEKSVPDHFSAPAKKLHQLINNSELGDAQSLEEKQQQRNKQITEIYKQLKAQDIDVPEQKLQVVAMGSDTKQRSSGIKDYIIQKQQPSN